VVVCWRLDRLGRNLTHLITMLEELQALGIALVSLAEGIDASTSIDIFWLVTARALLVVTSMPSVG